MLRTLRFFLFALAVCFAWSEIQWVNQTGAAHLDLQAEPVPGSAQQPATGQARSIPASPGDSDFQTVGVRDYLPVFSDRLSERMTFPLSWLSGHYHDFNSWRNLARAKVLECLLAQPPAAPFNPSIVVEQDRDTYIARKVVFNLTVDSRVLGFLLIPKGKGPFFCRSAASRPRGAVRYWQREGHSALG
jgi:hypothetical protein